MEKDEPDILIEIYDIYIFRINHDLPCWIIIFQ